jgi:primosomal protein N' (replication factor Y) (superfamily II helicase)
VSASAQIAIARVEPLTSARSLRGPFDYRLPPHLRGIQVGSVLIVPFGRRRVAGVVVELAERSEIDPSRLVEPIAALEAGARPELVRLGLWVAREYCSTAARGLSLVLPPGATGERPARAATERLVRLTPAGTEALVGEVRLGPRQRAVLERLGSGGNGPARAEGLKALAGLETLRRLERRGLVAMEQVERRREPPRIAIGAAVEPVRLNADQRAAVRRVREALDGAAGRRELLLHGVTGSGKTEVYLMAAAAALERRRGVIILVPEIGLAPQTVHRFRARLGDQVAVLHSALSPGERADEWRRLDRGLARIAVGPRSAVFAPVSDLGLVVIDEEHEAAYKQEGDPRYDAREVARHRAAQAGAVLVAGSATPRPESWAELERIELTGRATGAALPPVDVLDMRERAGSAGVLHPRTLTALAELERDGGKAIVLANRRGFSPHLVCRSCGRAWTCRDCDVSLVLHRAPAALRCHHCGLAEPVPDACPDCGSVSIARVGAGTQQVADALAAATSLPVLRLDSDAAARRGAHAEILARFEREPAAVLVGTQMVAKGHDFPDVVLGIAVDADASLRFADFRAEERTFALIAQLAGRSGRGRRPGRVLVQTLTPAARPIAAAARHDTAGFLASELERRRALRYPPFAHLARVELAAASEAAVEEAAAELRDRLGAGLAARVELLGPAPLHRRRGRHRRQLLLKAAARHELADPIRAAVEAAAAERRLRGIALAVDLDPQ